MYNNKSMTKDKEQMRFLDAGIGLKARKKISVKLDTNKYFEKSSKDKKDDKKKKSK